MTDPTAAGVDGEAATPDAAVALLLSTGSAASADGGVGGLPEHATPSQDLLPW
ncbi:MAG: hypothetical protein JO075_06995 [Acidimicrobiia bacterium]|nr:hypothetical protein [Acidimicrobiia bacterium]